MRQEKQAEYEDAIHELVARSKDHRKLRAFHRLHRAHPEILDFLVAAANDRLQKGFRGFSFNSLWHYARWKTDLRLGPDSLEFMNDHSTPFYARAIVILHPELNGRAELRESTADEVFGLAREPRNKQKPSDYASRLRWATGELLEDGWRPKIPHVVPEDTVERFNIR